MKTPDSKFDEPHTSVISSPSTSNISFSNLYPPFSHPSSDQQIKPYRPR